MKTLTPADTPIITVLCGEHATAAHQSQLVVRHDVCGHHAPLRDLLAVRPL